MSTQAEAMAYLEAHGGTVTVPLDGAQHCAFRMLAVRGHVTIKEVEHGQVEVTSALGVRALEPRYGLTSCCGAEEYHQPKARGK